MIIPKKKKERTSLIHENNFENHIIVRTGVLPALYVPTSSIKNYFPILLYLAFFLHCLYHKFHTTINAFFKHKRYKFTNCFFFSRSTAYLKYNDQTTPYQSSLLDPAFAIGHRTNCVISSRCYRISLNIFKRFVSVMNLLVRVLKNKTIFVDTKLLLCFFPIACIHDLSYYLAQK